MGDPAMPPGLAVPGNHDCYVSKPVRERRFERDFAPWQHKRRNPQQKRRNSAQTRTVVRAEQVEVIRLVVPAGKEIEEHKAKGEIIVQCIEWGVPKPVIALYTRNLVA